jgi:hypothetical protein
MVWFYIITVVVVFVIVSCNKVNSDSNRRDERLEMLSRLTLDDCLTAYEEYGINFIINDGYMVNYIRDTDRTKD